MLPQRRSGWHLLDLRLQQPGTFIGSAAGAVEPMMALVGGWGQERVGLLRRGVAIHYWHTLPVAIAVSSVSLVSMNNCTNEKKSLLVLAK